MLRLQLAPADLCRVRFVKRLHPVGTAMMACQALRDPTVSVMAPGLVDRAATAGADGAARAATVTLRHLLPARGRLPDFLTPFDGVESVAAGLEAIRATSPRRIRAEVTAAYADVAATPLRRRFAAADPEALDLLGRAVDTWFGAVLTPHWSDLVSTHHHQVAGAAHRLAMRGLAGLFTGLHPAIRWRPPVLEVRTWWSGQLTGTGHGLILLPSPLAGPLPRVLVEPGRPVLLVYPVPMPRPVAGATTDALGRLLGVARAVVLRRLAECGELSTTALADAAKVSVSSASEHATALRAANLVTSDRCGGAVLHRLTPLGAHLLGGGPGAPGGGGGEPAMARATGSDLP
ncbi:helix-turn-helix domain-containing protein [Micromonospora phytophila]|uniref:ArsR/SmtB family transcription factor n=1 Tax=Micromonospora phytophila TaxID=709888 RepID=UPI00202F58F1|nr:helix-turn-helix domain-containing protein [Micromonospora phytophila]MCM0675895.1 helix-turn-helix domain-containing protein [Micromonospora phytophila]